MYYLLTDATMLAHIISSNKTLEEIRAELEDEADDEAVVCLESIEDEAVTRALNKQWPDTNNAEWAEMLIGEEKNRYYPVLYLYDEAVCEATNKEVRIIILTLIEVALAMTSPPPPNAEPYWLPEANMVIDGNRILVGWWTENQSARSDKPDFDFEIGICEDRPEDFREILGTIAHEVGHIVCGHFKPYFKSLDREIEAWNWARDILSSHDMWDDMDEFHALESMKRS